MSRPRCLIIGAMKAGTTTLFKDLSQHPDIFFSHIKEPESLCNDAIYTKAGIQAYEQLFRYAKPGQMCADASTAYTKRPIYEGVPERARDILPDDVKLIYIVRDPIERALSHHYHLYSANQATADVDAGIRSRSDYVDFSKYAMQLKAWRDVFSAERIRVVRFEDYMADRIQGYRELISFLGLKPDNQYVSAQAAQNVGDSKLVGTSRAATFFYKILPTEFYQNRLRPWMPDRCVRAAQRVLFSPAPPRPKIKTIETIDYLIDQLQEDTQELANMLGLDQPWWDLQETRQRYVQQWQSTNH